jgi:hypothetical protein
VLAPMGYTCRCARGPEGGSSGAVHHAGPVIRHRRAVRVNAKGVIVNANLPDAPPSLWQQILVGFGPTLLFVGLLLWFLLIVGGFRR